MRYWLVMPAAGVGQRFGDATPKQYAPLAGRTVLEWALAPFLADRRCAGIVLALAAGDAHWPRLAARLPAVDTVSGGAQRAESVLNGLRGLQGRADPSDWVLVHDAVRPCLAAADLDRLIEELGGHPVGGLLAVPLADTLKRSGRDRVIERTEEREGLWRAHTPQMFRLGPLRAALERALGAGRSPTDEAQALEWTGAHARLVAGSPSNVKITTPEDLALAAAVLAARAGAERGRVPEARS